MTISMSYNNLTFSSNIKAGAQLESTSSDFLSFRFRRFSFNDGNMSYIWIIQQIYKPDIAYL